MFFVSTINEESKNHYNKFIDKFQLISGALRITKISDKSYL